MTSLPPRVLLIGQSARLRRRYAASLQRQGFCTLQACSAAEARRLAAELPPSAVVSEAHLASGESGLQLTRQLKQDHGLRHVPVVILSGGLGHDREAAARAGCDRFLPDTVQPDALSRFVAALIHENHESSMNPER